MVNREGTGRHRIFCLMGKSGTGKDTIYRELLSDGALPFERLVPCTTRPIRAGEQDGREYHFYSVEEFRALERAGKIVESRCYETVHGPWYYFTADDGQIDLARHSTLMIGTLESYLALRAYYGADKVVPVYIEVEDGERLQRALDRERSQRRRSRRRESRSGFIMMTCSGAGRRSRSTWRRLCERGKAWRRNAEIFRYNRPEGHYRAFV